MNGTNPFNSTLLPNHKNNKRNKNGQIENYKNKKKAPRGRLELPRGCAPQAFQACALPLDYLGMKQDT